MVRESEWAEGGVSSEVGESGGEDWVMNVLGWRVKWECM